MIFIITYFLLLKIALLEGEGDEYPESAFYMQGNLEEALEEGRRLAATSKK